MMSGNESSMPVKPALEIASSFRGSVSEDLHPIEQDAYETGMSFREDRGIVAAIVSWFWFLWKLLLLLSDCNKRKYLEGIE